MDELQKVWTEYVDSFQDWSSFWTLTFSEADRSHDVTRPQAEFLWRRLVQILNNDLYGHHYTRIVHHSYFGYALAFEYRTTGALHMHALISGRTNWDLVHKVWEKMAGFVFIEKVKQSEKASRYLCKYVVKGADVKLYRPGGAKIPAFQPDWFTRVDRSVGAEQLND